MKIQTISAYEGDDSTVSVSVSVSLGAVSVPEAVALVTSALLYQGAQYPNASLPAQVSASAPAAPTSTSTEADSTEPTRRRRRTAAEMEAARSPENPTAAAQSASENTAPPTDASTASEGTSRRRRAAAPPANDPMPINDAEMSKAASNTAEEFAKLGEDGVALVKAVLEDYGVPSVGEIPQERRKAFIKELAKEVDLAKQEHASKQA